MSTAALAAPSSQDPSIAPSSAIQPPKPSLMEVMIDRDTLLTEISVAQRITSTKTTIPILSNLLVEAGDGVLSVTASNLDQTLRTRAAAKVNHAGAATVPARKFLDYVKLLPTGEIRIKLLENCWVQIQAGRSKTKMVGMARENFPQVPTPDKLKSIPIPVSLLRSLISHTILAVSTEESRHTLNAALLLLEPKKILMVATDGHRLAIAEQMQDLGSIPATRKLLIPAKAMHDLASLSASTSAEVVDLFENETTIFFRFGYREYSTRKITGAFPNYLAVIPANNQQTLIMPTMDLERSVRRVAQFADNKTNAVKLSLAANSLKIASSSEEAGESEDTIDVPYTGPAMAIKFNSSYILDFSKAVGGGGEVQMNFKDGSSAGFFSPVDRDRTLEFRYVVMPMRA